MAKFGDLCSQCGDRLEHIERPLTGPDLLFCKAPHDPEAHWFLMDEQKTIDSWAKEIHALAVSKGWWEFGTRNDGEMIALMHSELSEALEAMRTGNKPSLKAEGFSEVEEELADVIIRILDYSEAKGYDIEGAMKAKFNYNKKREYRHGGKVF